MVFAFTHVSFGPAGTGIGAVLVAFGMLMFIRMPVVESYIIEKTNERNRSTILGIYYFTNMEIGAVLTPPVGNN